jgi:hypothetical protein
LSDSQLDLGNQIDGHLVDNFFRHPFETEPENGNSKITETFGTLNTTPDEAKIPTNN